MAARNAFVLVFVGLISGTAGAESLGTGVRTGVRGAATVVENCLKPLPFTVAPVSGSFVGGGATLSPSQLVRWFLREDLLQEVEQIAPEASFVREALAGSDTIDTWTEGPADYAFKTQIAGNGEPAEVLESRRPLLSEPTAWSKLCGDQVILQRRLGAMALINVHVRLVGASPEVKAACQTELSNAVQAASPMWANLREAFRYVRPEVCPGARLTLGLLQLGGDIKALPAGLVLQRHEQNRFYAAITCDLANTKACADAGQALAGYVLSPKGFIASVDPRKQPEEAGGPAVTRYRLGKYSWIGVWVGK